MIASRGTGALWLALTASSLGSGVVASMSLGAGCASEPQDESVTDRPSRTPAPLDALRRRFGRVRDRVRDRGYRERRTLPRIFVLEGQGEVLALDLPVGVCSTFVALGSGGIRDLDLTLYDGDGEEAVVDAFDGEAGLAHVCPPGGSLARTLPYYLVIESVEGSGAVVSGVFESEPDPDRGGGFEGLFDGVLAPRVPLREVESKLAHSRTALRSRGLVPLAEPRFERVAEGEVVRFPVSLEQDRCYVAVAHGGDGMQDVDLFLFDSAGAEVARDLESNASPSLEHCPDDSGNYLVEVRAFEGAGALGVMILAGPTAPRASDEESVDPEAPPDGGAPSEDPVASVNELAAQLSERGYQSVFVVRDVSIAPGEVRHHEVLLGPGCGIVIGAGVPGMDLDLYLSDPGGVALDRDTRVEPTARVGACPDDALVRRVTAKAYGTDGPYALAVLRAPVGIEDVRSLRLEEATTSLRGRGYIASTREEASLERGERLAQTLVVAPHTCVAVAAAGDAAVEDLDLLLRGFDAELVASESGPAPWATVTRCAEERGERLTLELVMYRGSGEVILARMSRHPSRGPGPATAGAPTAPELPPEKDSASTHVPPRGAP